MPKDRSWVLLDDHRLEAFQKGSVEFLDFAFPKCAIDNKIRCPCRDCKCRKFGDRDFVHKHLLWRGWDKLYGKGRWRFHLESEEEYDATEMNDANDVQILDPQVVPQSDGVGIDVGDNMNELLHACLHQDQQEPLEEPVPKEDDPLEKFGKSPTVVDTYKKAYISIDALEERGSNNGEDDTAEPYIGTTTPEQIAISTNLERVYEECMLDEIEESTTNTLTIERVLGKRKELGIKSSSSTSKAGKSRLSSTRQEEMEFQMKLMQEQLQLKDDKVKKLEEQAQRNAVEMNQLKETMNKLLESLRQQGIQAEPSTTSNNGGT